MRNILAILISFLILTGLGIFESFYVNEQFDDFGETLEELYEKTKNKTANEEDAKSIREVWSRKKEKLHVYIPHNDISYIDYWLSEAVSLIATKDYDLARSKIEVLIEICDNIPDAYRLSMPNIF